MKKLINTSFIYAIVGICCGVFYREFTKFTMFEGRTTLAFTHLHFLVLGTLVFLILALFSINTDLLEQKKFKLFFVTYNIGIIFMQVMFFVRGILQVLATPLSSGANAAISGITGVAHIIVTFGVVLLFLCLRKITILPKSKKSK
ncbi:MAG: DUF2871 domain-containing protein [Clostridia bacterium]